MAREHNFFPAEKIYKTITKSLDCSFANPVSRILAGSISAVNPYQVVLNSISTTENSIMIADKKFDLNDMEQIILVSIGKAAGYMAQAACYALNGKITKGIVVDKQIKGIRTYELPEKILLFHANHPVPGKQSVKAGTAVLEVLKDCADRDMVLFLISGGASSLCVSPQEGISLLDIQIMSEKLLECGATINEINAIRKHLDAIKGGGLAKAAFPAEIVTLVLSDVIGNSLDTIGSGPTVADPTTFNDVRNILDKYNLWDQLPGAILATLKNGLEKKIPETLKPGDQAFDKSHIKIIGSVERAVNAGCNIAQNEGFHTSMLTTNLQGEAFTVGQCIGCIAREMHTGRGELKKPACVIAGGETTVTVRGNGLGGRNLEVALGAVAEIKGLQNVIIITLATDGEDGPTDAAGAVVKGSTYQQALDLGLNIEMSHENNDSYHFFKSLDALVKIGSTGTNVNDISYVFIL